MTKKTDQKILDQLNNNTVDEPEYEYFFECCICKKLEKIDMPYNLTPCCPGHAVKRKCKVCKEKN